MRRWLTQAVPWGVFVFTILLLGITFGVGVAFAIRSAIDSHDAKTAALRQQEGRAVAVDVLCGFSNGVADAGRRALAGKLEGMSRGRGLPEQAQADYVSIINQRLIAQAGVRGEVLIASGPNAGLIDCRRLRKAAKATHTHP